MRQHAHYFKIGLFVIGATILAVIGIIVFGGGKWFERVTMVETYFNESVQGLEIGAPVRLRGVRMGRVESIRLAREEYNIAFNPEVGLLPYKGVVVVRMSVRLSVAAHFPEKDDEMRMRKAVDAGWRFKLASQGITGVLYIESEFVDPERNPPMEIAWTPKTPYIPSGRSTVTVLGSALTKIAKDLEQAEVHKVMADLDALVLSLTKLTSQTDLSELSVQAGQTFRELRGTLQQARSILANPAIPSVMSDAAATAEEAKKLVSELSHTSRQLRRLSEELPGTLTRLDTTVRRVDHLVASKSQDIDEILANLRVVSADLRDVMTNAKRYPSQVFLGEPPPHANSARR